MHGQAEQCFSTEHHYPKPNIRQIIPWIAWRTGGNKGQLSQFSAAEVVTMKREIDMKQKNEAETAPETNEPKIPAGDGVDRRNFLQCMAWAGTGLVWSFVAGVPTSKLLADTGSSAKKKTVEDFSLVQISDSHIGFNKAATRM
jgi:hypothetical protein